MDIHEALELIQEWVNNLEDQQLPQVCRDSGNDFFAFLKRKGFDPGTFIRTVTPIIGYHPRNLWSQADAATLRRAISSPEWD